MVNHHDFQNSKGFQTMNMCSFLGTKPGPLLGGPAMWLRQIFFLEAMEPGLGVSRQAGTDQEQKFKTHEGALRICTSLLDWNSHIFRGQAQNKTNYTQTSC